MKKLNKEEIEDLKKKISGTGGYGMKYISRLNQEVDPTKLLNEMSIFSVTRDQLIQYQLNNGRGSTVRKFLDEITPYSGWGDDLLRALVQVQQGELANFLHPRYTSQNSELVGKVTPLPGINDNPPPYELYRSTSEEQERKLRECNENAQLQAMLNQQNASTFQGVSELPAVDADNIEQRSSVAEDLDQNEFSNIDSIDATLRRPQNPSFEVQYSNNEIPTFVKSCMDGNDHSSQNDDFFTTISVPDYPTEDERDTEEITTGDRLISSIIPHDSINTLKTSSHDKKSPEIASSSHDEKKTPTNDHTSIDTSSLESMKKYGEECHEADKNVNYSNEKLSQTSNTEDVSEIESSSKDTSLEDDSTQASQPEEDTAPNNPQNAAIQQNTWFGWFNGLFDKYLDTVAAN